MGGVEYRNMTQVSEAMQYTYFDILMLASPKEHDRWKYTDGDLGTVCFITGRHFSMHKAIIIYF